MNNQKSTITPRHVICVLGKWNNFDAVETIVRQFGDIGFELDREFSQLVPDERMIDSFEVCYDRVEPSMTEEDWQAVREHSAVAYVLSPPILREQADEISGTALLLIDALLKGGGIAAKGESAGIAHGRDKWIEMATAYIQAGQINDVDSQVASLYWAWVRRPLWDKVDGVFYSCGMHLLGGPDFEINSSLEIDEAVKWIDLLGLYLIVDKPERPIKDGEGFRLSDPGPRRIMRFGPCERYEDDGFTFNPYGYIRLESETA